MHCRLPSPGNPCPTLANGKPSHDYRLTPVHEIVRAMGGRTEIAETGWDDEGSSR